MKYLFILIIGALIISCKDEQKQVYLNEISSMERELDSMQSLVDKHRVDTLSALISHIKNKTSEVQKNYYTDTVDYDVANMMNSFKLVRKGLSSNSGNLAKVRNSIPEVKEKLSDLRFDITKGVGKRNKYREYINYEKEKIKQIEEILSYYIETKEKYIVLYKETAPKVDAFIKELKSEK